MKIQCIIFDCDGTLVDSEHLAMNLLIEMAAENGIALARPETSREFAGMRLHRVVARLESRYQANLPESFIDDYRRRLLESLQQGLTAMPHIHETLNGLSLPRCVASNAPLAKIRLCLTSAGLLDFFGDNIYSAYEVGSWKPEPGLFLAAAKGMGFDPKHCLVVEDSEPGIRAALEAGTTVVAYQRPDISHSDVLHMRSHRELDGLIRTLN